MIESSVRQSSAQCTSALARGGLGQDGVYGWARQPYRALSRLFIFREDEEVTMELGLRIAEVPVRWRHAAGSRVRAVRDVVTCTAGVVRIRANARKGVYRFGS